MESNRMTPAIGPFHAYRGSAKGVTGFVLKLIAVITMLIDHTAAALIEPQLYYGSRIWVSDGNWELWSQINQVMRCIGRMAFPIYIFLLVEGFMHTRSVGKYIRNLVIFAILSEIPFDLAFHNSLFDWSYNNVFITLLLGLLTIAGLKWVDDHLTSEKPSIIKYFGKSLVLVVIILAMMLLAEFLNTDYSGAGVAAIAVMYLLRNYRTLGFATMVVLLGFMCGNIEWLALFMLVPIYFYNGKRGLNSTGIKYFFYAFYPVHLLILAGIGYMIGIHF